MIPKGWHRASDSVLRPMVMFAVGSGAGAMGQSLPHQAVGNTTV